MTLNDRKVRWIIQEKLGGRCSSDLAAVQKVTRRCLDQLWMAYRQNGRIPSLKQPRRPRRPLRLGETTLILQAYYERRGNGLVLEKTLDVEYGVHIPHNRIHEALKMTLHARAEPAKQARRRWVRYERAYSMSLWHMDWKQLKDGSWILAILDDASRLVVWYGVYPEATTEHTLVVLKEAIQRYGCPDEILTDRGSQFYASEGEHKEKGVSQFESYLAERGIKHILCRVNHPQTNGKLERFYGVLDQKWHEFRTVTEYVRWHNEIKLDMRLRFKVRNNYGKSHFPVDTKFYW